VRDGAVVGGADVVGGGANVVEVELLAVAVVLGRVGLVGVVEEELALLDSELDLGDLRLGLTRCSTPNSISAISASESDANDSPACAAAGATACRLSQRRVRPTKMACGSRSPSAFVVVPASGGVAA